MVRTPAKTCPNISRLIDEIEPALLGKFLQAKAFKNQKWLNQYKPDQGGSEDPAAMLRQEKKDRLSPLETEAAQIVSIAANRGQFALHGLASTKLAPDRLEALRSQRDELARSLWIYVNEPALFEAAANALHLHLYRRYDKHYQTFPAEPSQAGGPTIESAALQSLLADLRDSLDRGEGYSIDKFDIPGEGEEPPAEMYLLFHPEPPTSGLTPTLGTLWSARR